MKFYYNDKLVRMSKNHHYTHGLMNHNGKIIACSATREGAGVEQRRYISECERGIENAIRAIKALEAGRNGCIYTFGKQTYYHTFSARENKDFYKNWIEENNQRLEVYRSWKVVELEERA